MEDLLEDLAAVDVVYLGETHRLERHHRLQAEVVRGLAKSGRPLILGMEQIEARNQVDVDRFNSGAIDFEGLAEAIEWEKQWNNYEAYQEIIEAARKAGGRLVGLNGPQEVIRQVGRNGLEGIETVERASLPEGGFSMIRSMKNSWRRSCWCICRWRRVFCGRSSRRRRRGMNRWRRRWSIRGRKPIAVVICGAGHCQFGLGTPDRVRRRLPEACDRIVLMSESGDLELTDEEKAMSRDIEIHHRDLEFIKRPVADYLHAKEPKPEDEENLEE